MHPFPAEGEQGDPLPSRFSSSSINKGPFRGLLTTTLFTALCFFWVILLFKMAPKHSAERRPLFLSTRELGRACLRGKTRASCKLPPAMSCSEACCEVKVNDQLFMLSKVHLTET